jgi:methionyl-tRNA formyltransferase
VVASVAARGHTVTLCFEKADLPGGDMLFLASCGHIVRAAERQEYDSILVLHASDLPLGPAGCASARIVLPLT